MVRFWSISGVFISLVFFALSCAPQSAPAPAIPPAALPAAPTVPSPVAPTLSPEDAAWAKVVEAAKKEGKVNVYSYSMTGDVGVAVARAFAQRYGIKLEIITGGGSAMSERIKTEKRMGTMVADVFDANTFQISNIKDIGATVSSEDLPALRESGVWRVEPWANDPQRHKLIHSVLYYTPLINTTLVKQGDEPRSLKELAQAKWKGRMTAFDPKQNSGIYDYFLPLLKRKAIDLDTLQAIGKNVVWTATVIDAGRNVMQGQSSMYIGGGGVVFAPYVALEPSLPVKLLDMEEGVVVSNQALAQVKDGPYPNAAKLLVNWLFTPEGQRVFVGTKALVSVRKDVPDFTPASLRLTPTKLVVPTTEEEQENIGLFREGWLAKFWGR